ncbi:Uncharacterised protein [Acinetobacter baumannii]|uniref:hypothetical protein n=1 Tax=Providencia sp. PROV261 TaxID=2949949 RepID=UPI000DE6454A|nr:hypothetical protein [Providencia sp. PROV261]SST02815.1 Uncharacterised protein [Acinetobacter baumannii]
MKAQPKTPLNVTLYIHAQKQFDGSYRYRPSTFKYDIDSGLGFVIAEHTVDIPFTAPSSTELVQLEIDALKAEQNKILADAQVKSSLLEDQIQMLLCLEGKPISKIDEELPY